MNNKIVLILLSILYIHSIAFGMEENQKELSKNESQKDEITKTDLEDPAALAASLAAKLRSGEKRTEQEQRLLDDSNRYEYWKTQAEEEERLKNEQEDRRLQEEQDLAFRETDEKARKKIALMQNVDKIHTFIRYGALTLVAATFSYIGYRIKKRLTRKNELKKDQIQLSK